MPEQAISADTPSPAYLHDAAQENCNSMFKGLVWNDQGAWLHCEYGDLILPPSFSPVLSLCYSHASAQSEWEMQGEKEVSAQKPLLPKACLRKTSYLHDL